MRLSATGFSLPRDGSGLGFCEQLLCLTPLSTSYQQKSAIAQVRARTLEENAFLGSPLLLRCISPGTFSVYSAESFASALFREHSCHTCSPVRNIMSCSIKVPRVARPARLARPAARQTAARAGAPLSRLLSAGAKPRRMGVDFPRQLMCILT
jgi:hypothetical protein